MEFTRKLALIGLAAALSLGVIGCENETDAEEIGEQVDEQLNEVGNTVEDACEDLKEEANAEDQDC